MSSDTGFDAAYGDFRRSLMLAQGSYDIFFTRLICLLILSLTVFSIIGAYVKQKKKQRAERATVNM